jgi:Kelch motif
MNTARQSQDATLLPDGDVLVTAGVSSAGLFSELYHPATGQWSDASAGLSQCAAVRACRFGSTATLLGTGNVLVAGGFTGLNSNPSSTATAMLYNPATNAWTSTGSMGTPRTYQMASLLPSGQVLIAGGTTFSNHRTTFRASAELYTP